MRKDLLAYRDLLRNRNFGFYVFSYYLASIGGAMTLFAIWSQAARMTDNNPMAIGLSGILDTLPSILLAPWAGLLADRYNKRNLMIFSRVMQGVSVALLLFATELWQLYVLAALHSTFVAFEVPPHRALMPQLVREDQYVTMNAFMVTVNSLTQFFRPALAGLVVSTFGYKAGFSVNVAAQLLSAGALLFVVLQAIDRTQDEVGAQEKTSMWAEVRAGLSYIRTQPVLMYLFLFSVVMTFCFSTQGPLTQVFVGDFLADTPDQVSARVGLLFSAIGIGGVLGALVTPRLISRVPIFLLLLVSLCFDGVVVILFSQCDTLLVAMACYAFFGIIGSVSMIVQDTLIQSIVPENLRGRVYGAFGPITGPFSLLSVACGTSLATVIGVRGVFLLCGVLEILAVIICRVMPSYSSVRASLAEKKIGNLAK
ncbi:MFS transporter [Tumebacillus permanentifrigoris]|uniref:Putative MFS family arabinose efflux permease n=1 Tax=Tumebacillus permanentifrigoris TaxID=378543 RepID=A0A316D3X6_9BACL|nr:MFS transporter [Tumebacillus permanentifrigoris]PWK05049.1 putative MFS family arabinose efflux permease [Tumebacillus permanentifrigoris]